MTLRPLSRILTCVVNLLFVSLKNDFWATPLQDTASHKSWRPLTTLTYKWTFQLHGMEPLYFHFVNILLNATCCYLVVHYIKCISTSYVFSCLTCLLFTFHPIHTEVVATLVGRADLLSAMLALVCVIIHMNYCIQSQ
jgi:hypothetical protein